MGIHPHTLDRVSTFEPGVSVRAIKHTFYGPDSKGLFPVKGIKVEQTQSHNQSPEKEGLRRVNVPFVNSKSTEFCLLSSFTYVDYGVVTERTT